MSGNKNVTQGITVQPMFKIYKFLLLVIILCILGISAYAYLGSLPANQVKIIQKIKLDES